MTLSFIKFQDTRETCMPMVRFDRTFRHIQVFIKWRHVGPESRGIGDGGPGLEQEGDRGVSKPWESVQRSTVCNLIASSCPGPSYWLVGLPDLLCATGEGHVARLNFLSP